MFSIRTQIMASLMVATFVVALLLLPFAQGQVGVAFDAFERAHGHREAGRLAYAARSRASELERTVQDYAYWDETADYVQGRNPQWADSNLTPDVFENFGAASIALFDTALRLRVARHRAGAPTPDAALAALARERALCTQAMVRKQPLHRYLLRDGAPWLLVCGPIEHESPNAAPVGAMLWLVPMQTRARAEMSELAGHRVALEPATVRVRQVRPTAVDLDIVVPLADWDGHTRLQAHIRPPLPLGAQRQATTRTLLGLMTASVIIAPLLMLALIGRLVVRPIEQVTRWVRAFSAQGADPRRLQAAAPVGRGFLELDTLTRDFAALAAQLDASRAGWKDEAMRDSLTDLGSRPRLLEDMAARLDARDGTALLLLDLDGFKAVNDLLGHPAGDIVLQDVAQLVRDQLPDGAHAYRLGGDEFAVLLAAATPAPAVALAEALCARIHLVRHARGRPMSVTTCIGVAACPPAGTCTVSDMLSRADLALYAAKRRGRGQHERFSDALHEAHRTSLQLEAGLRLALAEGRVQSWLQPIVDAHGGRVLAFEALARWHDAEAGWIPPDRFIATAEQTGQVVELDLAVATHALLGFKPLWERAPRLQLHLNASAQSVVDPRYAARLARLVEAAALPPATVGIELTETDLAVSTGHLERALATLTAHGLRFVIDDFGVGASSLGRLAQLQPDALKIDGSFVRDLDGNGGRICRAIIELAHGFGTRTVAEYVETDADAAALRAMGCDALQGFGIGRPMPAPDALAWLQARMQA